MPDNLYKDFLEEEKAKRVLEEEVEEEGEEPGDIPLESLPGLRRGIEAQLRKALEEHWKREQEERAREGKPRETYEDWIRESKEAQERLREEEGQRGRFEEYAETGRDPLELKRLEEQQRIEGRADEARRRREKEEREEEKLRRMTEEEKLKYLKEKRKAEGRRYRDRRPRRDLAGDIGKEVRRQVVAPIEKTERVRSLYMGKASPGLYDSPGLRMYPGRASTPDFGVHLRQGIGLEPLRQATMFRPIAATPVTRPTPTLFKPWVSPYAQLLAPPQTQVQVETRTRPTPQVREEAVAPQLRQYIEQKGAEPISKVRMPAYFFIGTKKGVEASDESWIVSLATGRYGIAGIGNVTGKPRMKISWASPEEALDAAGDIPGGGRYPVRD